MRILIYFSVFISALLASLVFVSIAIKAAVKYDIQDHPIGRKDHGKATPLLGGMGIYLGFIVTVVIGIILLKAVPHIGKVQEFFPFLPDQLPLFHKALPKLLFILTGGTLLVAIGLVDDVKGLDFSPKIKFIVQIVAAVIAAMNGASTDFMPFEFLNILVSVIWIVAICNAFNFLDNMDGLSAGIAAIFSAVFLWVTASQSQFFSALLFAALLGSIVGFLKYNFAPAKVFMGDTGSLFIGFMLGSLSLTSSYVVKTSSSLLPVVLPVIVLSVPIYDLISVIIIRIREKRPVYVGDHSHFSHRLVNLGMTKIQAVIFIYALCFTFGLAASLLPYLNVAGSITILIQTVLLYVIITILMYVGTKNKQN